MRTAPLTPNNYIIWVRDPKKRFVSAFNHSKNIVDFDTSGLDIENLSHDNCPAPEKILKKMQTGFAFAPEYEFLVSKFETANDLAESLYDAPIIKRMHAHMLIRHPAQHLAKGIGWYLYNGAWVTVFKNDIKFVGTLESITKDFPSVKNVLNVPDDIPLLNIRENKSNLDKTLSKKALQNISRYYRDTDYKALEELKKHGFIDENYAT